MLIFAKCAICERNPAEVVYKRDSPSGVVDIWVCFACDDMWHNYANLPGITRNVWRNWDNWRSKIEQKYQVRVCNRLRRLGI